MLNRFPRPCVAAVAAMLSPLLLLAACAGDPPATAPTPVAPTVSSVGPTPIPTATPIAVTPSKDLSAITVSEGETPKVQFKAPWAIQKTMVKVLKEGTSPQKVAKTGYVEVNYVGVNGRTGEVFDTSYGKKPAHFEVGGVVKGFQAALIGKRVGSRVLVGMTSADGYADGRQEAGIEKGDNLVFVIDIISAQFGEPEGAPGTIPVDQPQVKVGGSGPSVTVPSGAAKPSKLGVYELVKGVGRPVTIEQTVMLRYRSFRWDGSVFEDAWAKPQAGKLDDVIAGWTRGVVGKTTGSRIVLVVPPELAFPQGRSTPPTLPPGEPLIYVIDLVYAAAE